MIDATNAERRRWADVVVIVASVLALFFAVWPFQPAAGEDTVRTFGWYVWAQALAGPLALAALALGGRLGALSKVLVALAGVLLLTALFSAGSFGTLPLVTMGLPGVALLAAAPFAGRMPTPEEEGKPRG